MLGVIFIVLLLEATRRTTGWIMPAVAILFIAYAMAGPYLPPPWTHRGYDLSRLVGHLFITLEGIFGVAVDVSSTLIIMFTIYGAFLQHSGAGKFFIDFSMALMGGKPNSAGRTVVLSSFLLGGPSGSGVATTVTIGAVAYPMMKQSGFEKNAAGGLLAAGGLGAILSPPVLGAAAFLIAEFLKISYLDVIWMATIPTCLYYLSLLFMVELDAKRFGAERGALRAADVAWRDDPALRLSLHVADRRHRVHGGRLFADAGGVLFDADVLPAERADARDGARAEAAAAAAAGHLGCDPGAGADQRAGVARQCAAARRTAGACARRPDRRGHRLSAGVPPGAARRTRGMLGLTNFGREETLHTKKLARTLSDGSIGVLNAATTCASAGIIVGVVTLTGLGLKFSSIVLDYAGGSLLLTAIYTALVVWIVGLAVPVTASYIICAVIAAPALTKLGVPDYAAHMFIFYYAVLSEVSPPTALSPFAAAAITGGDPYVTTLQAWKYTLPAFLVPFVFVLDPQGVGLLMKIPKDGSVWDILLITGKTAAGLAALAAAAQNWALRQNTTPERVLWVLAGLLLVFPSLLEALAERISGYDLPHPAPLGLAICVALLLKQFMSLAPPAAAKS